MTMQCVDVVVAGHICLDLIPVFPDHVRSSQLEPGTPGSIRKPIKHCRMARAQVRTG